MRILHELNCLELGGAERMVLNLAAGDRQNRHEVFAWQDGPIRAELEAAGIRVWFQFDPILACPDIVHVHTGGHESRMASYLRGKMPVVETIHSPLGSAVASPLLARRVAVSKGVQDVNPDAVVIHNGVDFARLEPVAATRAARIALYEQPGEVVPSSRIVIGWLGRLVPEKNLEAFLDVCGEVGKTLPVKAVLVGPSPAPAGQVPFSTYLAGVADARGIDLCVPGPRNPGRAIPAFDVFLSCSLIEAHPLVLIEAMWLGVPVVAIDCPVNRETLGDGAHGLLPENRLEAVAAAVLAARSRSPSKLGEAIAFAEQFSVRRMVTQYREVYAEVLAAARCRS